MAYFNRNNQSGGNRNFGKPRYNSDRPELHKAICSTCGNNCEVPFKPNGSKPVLCRDCFAKTRTTDTRNDTRQSFERPSFNRNEAPQRTNDVPDYKSQFEALNAKMDKILNILTSAIAEAPAVKPEAEEVVEELVEEKKEKVVKTPKKATKKTGYPKKK